VIKQCYTAIFIDGLAIAVVSFVTWTKLFYVEPN